MVNKTTRIYAFFDDILKTMNHNELERSQTSDTEIITVVLIAAQYIHRKRIETVFSDRAKYMPKKIHKVTENGFLIKLIIFIWTYTFDKLFRACLKIELEK